MAQAVNGFIPFIEKCPTAFHAVAEVKEILINNNWEMREEDVELICKMLFKLSNELVSEIKEIKLQPNV